MTATAPGQPAYRPAASPRPEPVAPAAETILPAALAVGLNTATRALWAITDAGVLWANARARELTGSSGALPQVAGRDLAELARGALAGGPVRSVRGPLGAADAGGPHEIAVPWLLDLDGEPGVLLVLDPDGMDREEADLVNQVQHALLPPTLPLLPGMRLSGSYHQATRVTAAGGDWYDAVSLGQGRLGLMIGDAVGHGIRAVGAMGRLRGALRASAQRDPSPAAVLAALDEFAAGTGDLDGASVFYGLLDTVAGRLRYAAAGHPAPLLVRTDGSSLPLDVVPRPPLGTVPGAPTDEQEVELAPGETLVLYSDGALTALGRPPADGMRRLAEASHRAVVSLDDDGEADLAGTVAEMLRGRFGRPDDVAVLVAHRRVATVSPLTLDLPAAPSSLSGLRRTLGRWLATLGMGEQDRVGVLVAAGEACANSVEHAYPDGEPGLVHVRAEVDLDGQLTVEVRDDGQWRTPDREPGDRGRGLLIMRQMVEGVRLTEDQGTTVTLTLRLRRGSVAEWGRPQAHGPEIAVVDRSGEVPVVRVTGVVDESSAEQMRIRLLEASRGGTTACALDLTDAQVFSSAGVRVVFAVARVGQSEGWRLQVRVPAAGMAEHVLGVVGASSLVDIV